LTKLRRSTKTVPFLGHPHIARLIADCYGKSSVCPSVSIRPSVCDVEVLS